MKILYGDEYDKFKFEINDMEEGIKIVEKDPNNMDLVLTFAEIFICGRYAFGYAQYQNVNTNGFYFAACDEGNEISMAFCHDGESIIDVRISDGKRETMEEAAQKMNIYVDEFLDLFQNERHMERFARKVIQDPKNWRYTGRFLELIKTNPEIINV